MKLYLIIILGVLVMLGIVFILLTLKSNSKIKSVKKVNNSRNTKTKKTTSTATKNSKDFEKRSSYTIEEISNIAKTSSNKKALDDALEYMVKHYKIPSKRGIATPKEAQEYLSIILNFLKNKAVNPKMMVSYSTKLKQSNPQYSKEIDDLEKKAISIKGA